MGGGDSNIKTWTWAEAVDEARRVASYLKFLDLPERSSIALCSKNCAHWILADLAIWMAGHVSVPLFHVLTADIVAYILKHSEARLLFVGKLDDPVWDQMKPGVPADLPTVALPLATDSGYLKWDDIVADNAPLRECAACPADETATIVYTSGSMGRPKGVMMSFDAMYHGGRNFCEIVDVRASDRELSYLPLAHVFERLVVEAGALCGGFQIFFAETLNTFLHDLRRARPTLFASVPRLWMKFQLGVFEKLPPQKLDRLFKIPVLSSLVKKKILKELGLDQVRMAVTGASPIPKEVFEWYRKLGLELQEGYGMTENFSYSHMSATSEIRPGYVGQPCPGVAHRISNSGEILVKSPCNMKGYFKMPELSDTVFTTDGFLRTGDLGELDEKGRLKITGRVKELFKTSKGKYVAPTPIENRLSNEPLVEACYVAGAGYHQPHGVVVLSEGAQEMAAAGERQVVSESLAKLLQDVNHTLPRFEQLAFLVVTEDVWSAENGFLTPTQKIKRSVLDAAYGPLADEWYALQKPIIWQDSE
jgi:long-subunit acyl-CoA synthetase (AMP-forming)